MVTIGMYAVLVVGFILAVAGCAPESLTDRITRECNEASKLYFEASGEYDKLPPPRYHVDAIAGEAWKKREPRTHDRSGKPVDALVWFDKHTAWSRQEPARREPTEAEIAEHEARQREYEQRQVQEWARECRAAKAAKVASP